MANEKAPTYDTLHGLLEAGTPEGDLEFLSAAREEIDLEPLLDTIEPAALAGLVERTASRLAASGDPPAEVQRRTGFEVLDIVRHRQILRRIPSAERDAWAMRILRLIEASHYTVGVLFRQRCEALGSRPFLEIAGPSATRSVTWRQAWARVETIVRGLLALGPVDDLAPIAILSENRLESALLDLACLSTGILDLPIPAPSTPADVGFILKHSGARTIVVSSAEQLEKVIQVRHEARNLCRIVVLDRLARRADAILLDDLLARAGEVEDAEVHRRIDAVRISDLATIMYTSGTTGSPKAIQFSQRNIVFKRFARALAIPDIGTGDVLLCYLPLYHTFGRYLELMGSIFWGASYCFLDNPSVEAMVRGMRAHRPTVFISVPKKWIQLQEAILQEVDAETATDAEILEGARRVTGGRLRWGLSAAGHLESEVFRFFQRQGVELMSGFGMTEATGGITMTPPGEYKDDSLGKPLPGIEATLGEDGELLIRGPYVMLGYLDPPAGERSFDDEGWFHTGDLMERDEDGHLRLIDRKKEIYKNIKGETIAPQRIENLFRDFESVGRVFLVGDHREFNTALIWPNPSYKHVEFDKLPPAERKAHFRSIVTSVNTFLAPYERIVDFAVVERDFSADLGELTPKGTPRRKVIEQNFADVIRLLYRRASVKVGGVSLIFPNWLFQALGFTAEDLAVAGELLTLPSLGTSLTVKRLRRGLARIGSCIYQLPASSLNLGSILTTPRLWLGNEELVAFAPIEVRLRERPGRPGEGIEWHGRAQPFRAGNAEIASLEAALTRPSHDLMDLHTAALLLSSGHAEAALGAVKLLERILGAEEGPLAEPARLILARAADSGRVEVRRHAFEVLVPHERESRFSPTLSAFLGAPGAALLDTATRLTLCELNLPDAKLEAFIAVAEVACRGTDGSGGRDKRAQQLLRFLASYGAVHPTRFRKLRAFLVRTTLFAERGSVRSEGERALRHLEAGFRQWLGAAQEIAVDPETTQEYRWEDVVVFEEGADEGDRRRLLSAMRNTSFLREAVFLFSGGTLVRLSDIPPGGVWVRLLSERHGKRVYRITVQTRFQGSYEIAANVNESLTPAQIQEEIHWLILCGEPGVRDPLVEDFGGYHEDQDIWSEEFIPGENLERTLRRLARHAEERERLRLLWPFFAWSALASHVDFWNRTGRRWEIDDPSMGGVIVPTHDYQTGARIVSVSARRPHVSLLRMFQSFRDCFVLRAEHAYPQLTGLVGWEIPFSSFLEVVGEKDGLGMLHAARATGEEAPADLLAALDAFVASVETRGFVPMRLHFAASRYLRWEELSIDATPQARARTLQELYDTYGLQKLASGHPEARVRFFKETVLRRAPDPLATGLEELIRRLRQGELVGDAVVDAVSELRSRLQPGPDEDYFLTRLSYPHLRPEDEAAFVRTDLGGRHQSEIVVTQEDHEGNPFHIRHALNPKEVGRLHRLFLAAKLDVRFRHEHQYLVAINDRGQIIAGIFYEIEEGGRTAHLEKIVVAERYRKKGVADTLMKEFFHRMSAAGAKAVTTGFFRPEYFYGYGFKIEKRYAGLVKSLDPVEKPVAPAPGRS